MKVEQVLHMIGGADESSYAANSQYQEKAIHKTKPILEEAVGQVYRALLPTKMAMADLGCSSGPNTFLVVYHMIESLVAESRRQGRQLPELQFFLNDLPGNDFNNIFKSLEGFEENVRSKKGGMCAPHFVVGLPGSFYTRLFPCESVHLFSSSYSLMWISQVPEGLGSKSNGHAAVNRGNIYIWHTSPPLVVKLYQEQFQRDFSLFLKLRFQELVNGGRMVLAFLGRKNKDVKNGELTYLWGLLGEALNSMVQEGLMHEAKLDSFDLPFYAPSMEEVESIIKREDLFEILGTQNFESNWDPYDDSEDDIVRDNVQSAANFTKCIRAVIEPTISSHFGKEILDDLFARYEINAAAHLLKEKTKLPVLVLSLKKNE